MTFQFTTTPAEDAEIQRRFNVERQAGVTKAASTEEYLNAGFHAGIRQWQVQALAERLAALAPAAVDRPEIVESFVAALSGGPA